MYSDDESLRALQRRYFEIAGDQHKSRSRLRASLELLLRDAPLVGSRVLDVGGGSGFVSFYAATHGAKEVLCLEPAAAGSNPSMESKFTELKDGLRGAAPVELIRETLQSFEPSDQYDLVIMNASVNHLDEEACALLPSDPAARDAYIAMFRKLASLTSPDGCLVVADAARRNAWGALGLRSPFAPTIEWRIHAQPSAWSSLARESGYSSPVIRWRAPRRLGKVGQQILGNKVGGWLTNSLFILTMRK